MPEYSYQRTYSQVTELKLEYSIAVESYVGDDIESTAVVRLSHHGGIGPASALLVTIFISAKTGQFAIAVDPAFWGTKLPELMPALLEIVDEYRQRNPDQNGSA